MGEAGREIRTPARRVNSGAVGRCGTGTPNKVRPRQYQAEGIGKAGYTQRSSMMCALPPQEQPKSRQGPPIITLLPAGRGVDKPLPTFHSASKWEDAWTEIGCAVKRDQVRAVDGWGLWLQSIRSSPAAERIVGGFDTFPNRKICNHIKLSKYCVMILRSCLPS